MGTKCVQISGSSSDISHDENRKSIVVPLPQKKAYHYFISYTEKHNILGARYASLVQTIHDRLSMLGYIGFGQTNKSEVISLATIQAAVKQSCTMIVVLSDDSARSDWRRFEWATAADFDVPVVCIADTLFGVGDQILDLVPDIPQNLLRFRWIDHTDEDKEKTLDNVVAWLA